MLQPEFCRERQRRLLDVMQRQRLDAVAVSLPQHAYYFTSYRAFWLHESAFVLHADGSSCLVCGNPPETAPAAQDVVTYVPSWLGTQRQEQPAVVTAIVKER